MKSTLDTKRSATKRKIKKGRMSSKYNVQCSKDGDGRNVNNPGSVSSATAYENQKLSSYLALKNYPQQWFPIMPLCRKKGLVYHMKSQCCQSRILHLKPAMPIFKRQYFGTEDIQIKKTTLIQHRHTSHPNDTSFEQNQMASCLSHSALGVSRYNSAMKGILTADAECNRTPRELVVDPMANNASESEHNCAGREPVHSQYAAASRMLAPQSQLSAIMNSKFCVHQSHDHTGAKAFRQNTATVHATSKLGEHSPTAEERGNQLGAGWFIGMLAANIKGPEKYDSGRAYFESVLNEDDHDINGAYLESLLNEGLVEC